VFELRKQDARDLMKIGKQGMFSLTDPVDELCARLILGWRYDPPYDVYDLNVDRSDRALVFFLNPKSNYFTIKDTKGGLDGYWCFGKSARVVGGSYWGRAIDLGLGIRPDLTGRGIGFQYVEAVVEFLTRSCTKVPLRVTIASFNRRAQRVWERADFRLVQRFFCRSDDMPYVILRREIG